MRTNTYDAAQGTIALSADRVAVVRQVASHYEALFGADPALHTLREQYAIAEDAVPSEAHRKLMPAFFFWTAWATTTQRPGSAHHLHQQLAARAAGRQRADDRHGHVVDREHDPAARRDRRDGLVLRRRRRRTRRRCCRRRDPLAGLTVTPSMRATTKYFYTVIALFLAQMTLGAITAHYAIEGQAFYGFQLSQILPYAVARTWHTQLGIFWIATAWLATGLYMAPALSGGREPKFQRLGVNVLFVALLLVVVGSLAGEWLGVQQRLDLDTNFFLGHQG